MRAGGRGGGDGMGIGLDKIVQFGFAGWRAAGTGCAAALDAERYLAELDHTDAQAAQAQQDVAAEGVTETVQTAGL